MLSAEDRQEAEAEARRKIVRFAARFGADSLLLARYAALPLVLTPELLNYLRNRFLRGKVAWVAEADLLLSDLCHQAGYEQYTMDPAVRARLLVEMRETEGQERMREVARLLVQYLRQRAQTYPYSAPQEREAQEWAALVYLPDRRGGVVESVAQALQQIASPTSATLGTLQRRTELARLVRITEELAPELQEYAELVAYAREIGAYLTAPPTALRTSGMGSITVGGITLPPPRETIAPIPSLPAQPQAGDIKINPLDGSEMVWIPAGTFLMGSDKYSREQPVHRVRLDGFWMQRTAVTVGQYEAFVFAMRDVGKQISGHAAEMPKAPKFNVSWKNKDHPMVNISWGDAEAYCQWAQVRLPTEAEWEYASRGGLEGKEYPWGDDWDGSKCVNSVGENNPGGTQRVGMYASNGYGLYDMSGNVWEWCADRFGERYYRRLPVNNPKGPKRGDARVVRGGSWINTHLYCFRCAYRDNYHPVLRDNFIGFRCCASGL